MTEEKQSGRPLLGALFIAAGIAVAVVAAYGFAKAKRERVTTEITAAIEMGRTGNVEGAVAELKRVVDENPENTDALFNYGVGLSGLEKIDEADAIFARILKINPKDWGAVAERATIHSIKGDLDQAFTLMESIPEGLGRIRERLNSDPIWRKHSKDDRMPALRAKHGLTSLGYNPDP
jgi:tetratricopeptide (TPR) repeat protein